MAIYPKAVRKLLPENKTQRKIKPTQIILHSAVSNASSLYGWFNQSGLESHFYIRRDGTVEQYMDTGVRADANYKANNRAISIETWDGGDPDRRPWNPAQMKALTDLVAWCAKTHNIPLRRCPGWDRPGVGGHSDFPGVWTPYRGKTCPGLARRPQVNHVIEAAQRGSAPLKPGDRTLRKGHQGDDVAALQRTLGITADGDFGSKTHQAVASWQSSRGLIADGVVGPKTWAALLADSPAAPIKAKPITPGGNNMELTDKTLHDIAEATRNSVLHHAITREGSSLEGTTSLAAVIAHFDAGLEHNRGAVNMEVQALRAELAEVRSAVKCVESLCRAIVDQGSSSEAAA